MRATHYQLHSFLLTRSPLADETPKTAAWALSNLCRGIELSGSHFICTTLDPAQICISLQTYGTSAISSPELNAFLSELLWVVVFLTAKEDEIVSRFHLTNPHTNGCIDLTAATVSILQTIVSFAHNNHTNTIDHSKIDIHITAIIPCLRILANVAQAASGQFSSKVLTPDMAAFLRLILTPENWTGGYSSAFGTVVKETIFLTGALLADVGGGGELGEGGVKHSQQRSARSLAIILRTRACSGN